MTIITVSRVHDTIIPHLTSVTVEGPTPPDAILDMCREMGPGEYRWQDGD